MSVSPGQCTMSITKKPEPIQPAQSQESRDNTGIYDTHKPPKKSVPSSEVIETPPRHPNGGVVFSGSLLLTVCVLFVSICFSLPMPLTFARWYPKILCALKWDWLFVCQHGKVTRLCHLDKRKRWTWCLLSHTCDVSEVHWTSKTTSSLLSDGSTVALWTLTKQNSVPGSLWIWVSGKKA